MKTELKEKRRGQKQELREKFPGVPEEAVNYFYAIASDIREILSKIVSQD